MAREAKFNSIMNEIQLSNLNHTIQITSFDSNSRLNKSTQVDQFGGHATPSPPLCMLLQQSHRDILGLQNEISRLTVSLGKSEEWCANLDKANSLLMKKLEAIDRKTEVADELNSEMVVKLDLKDKEVTNRRMHRYSQRYFRCTSTFIRI